MIDSVIINRCTQFIPKTTTTLNNPTPNWCSFNSQRFRTDLTIPNLCACLLVSLVFLLCLTVFGALWQSTKAACFEKTQNKLSSGRDLESG